MPHMDLEALVVDWGGVLTNDLGVVMAEWSGTEAFSAADFAAVMRGWFEDDPTGNPVQALERGELSGPDFEVELAAALRRASGHQVYAPGLLSRLFGMFEHAHDMTGLVRRAKDQGIRTALLSNSWANDYPEHLFDGMFDVVVISGDVGMRKPEPEIFLHTAELLGVPPVRSVFVDDLQHNIEAALALGYVAVRHFDYDTTVEELSALFGIDLR